MKTDLDCPARISRACPWYTFDTSGYTSRTSGAVVQLYTFDEAHLERLRDGDTSAESHFVAYFSVLLHAKLRARHVPSEVADNICQKTLTRVIRSLRSDGSIRQPNHLGAFVNSVCNRVYIELYLRDKIKGIGSIYPHTHHDRDGDWFDDGNRKPVAMHAMNGCCSCW